MDGRQPACVGCPRFGSNACKECNWRIEFQLIEEYGTFGAAREAMAEQFRAAKVRCLKTIISDHDDVKDDEDVRH